MSNRILFSGAFAAGLAFTVLATGAAHGADLGTPYYGAPEDKVEFGSGWYIRGDLGATRTPSITPTASNLLNNSHAQTYFNNGGDPQQANLAADGSAAPIVSGGSNLGYTASLGAGYQFNSWLRSDLIADFHKPIAGTASSGNSTLFCQTGIVTPQVLNSGGIAEPTTGDCTGNYKANLSSYDVLANVYVDLGTWSSVTPYVGAGVGLSFGHYSTSSTYIQGNGSSYNVSYTSQGGSTTTEDFDRTGSGTYYNFAWALMSGVGIDVYSHTKLDIGYRYLNLGKISGISGTLYSNEVRVGLRYMIDN